LRYLIIALIGIVSISCQNSGDKKVSNQDNTVQKESTNTTFVDFDMDMFVGKVFEAGSENLFTDDCISDFGCDCCASQIIFNNDSSFYYQGFCESDEYLLTGTFSISEDRLIAYFDGYCITNQYNWENEIDTSAVNYIMVDTTEASYQLIYNIDYCKHKIQLYCEEENELALETKLDRNVVFDGLDSRGFIRLVKEKIKL
jgi:hypothetical protein